MSEQKWFERDPLPRAVLDESGCIWVRNFEGEYDRVEPEERWSPYKEAKNLEMCFGPCTPLALETGAVPADDALTIPAGELKRALELRMIEHAKSASSSFMPNPDAAIKAGKIGELMKTINPNMSTTWGLTSVEGW